MLASLLRRARGVDPELAVGELARHLATSPPNERALIRELVADEAGDPLRAAAQIQLRVIRELPDRLERLVAHIQDQGRPVGLRLGLRAVLRGVVRHADVLPMLESRAVSLLEPTLVLHTLTRELEPWLPTTLASDQPEAVLDLLRLGVPDFMRPIAEARIESSWQRFHRLARLGANAVDPRPDIMKFDDERLARLLAHPRARPPAPERERPAPQLGAPERDAPIPYQVTAADSLELVR